MWNSPCVRISRRRVVFMVLRYVMHPSNTFSDVVTQADRRASFRTAFVDGRAAELVVRDHKLPVRILDESAGGFRVTTDQVCELPDQSRTVLELDSRDIAVRLIYKRLEGARTLLGLQRLPS